MKKVIDKESQLMKKVDWQDDSICYVAILSETVQNYIFPVESWKIFVHCKMLC